MTKGVLQTEWEKFDIQFELEEEIMWVGTELKRMPPSEYPLKLHCVRLSPKASHEDTQTDLTLLLHISVE